ncbi:hypothetical protein F52700_1283 [Fusarium sp. NRRL 52700]|nr:hypothetical protein F52700_1283 [Fusarium sp. NRRL 52700]
MVSTHSPDALKTARFAATTNNDYSLDDSAKSQLISINVACVNQIETAAGTCIDTIRDLKGTQPNRDNWGNAIKSAYLTAKHSFSSQIDKAMDEAIKVIDAFPPAQQDGAADFMCNSMDIVADAVDQALPELGSIGGRYLEDLLAGKWNKLTGVENEVKATCVAAVNALNSML